MLTAVTMECGLKWGVYSIDGILGFIQVGEGNEYI